MGELVGAEIPGFWPFLILRGLRLGGTQLPAVASALWGEQANSAFTLSERYLLQVSAHLEHKQDWVLEHRRQARTWCETWQGFWHERGEGHVQAPVPAGAASASDAQCPAFGCCPRLRLSQPRPGSWQSAASSELLCKQGCSNTGGFCPFCPSFSPVPAAVPTSAGCAALRLSD